METLTQAAAIAISKIALEKFVGSGAEELGRNLTSEISQKVMKLGSTVWNRIQGNSSAVTVLERAAQEEPEAVHQLRKYLYSLWQNDSTAGTRKVRQLSDEIHFEMSQIEDNSNMNQTIQDNATGFQNRGEGSTFYQGNNYIFGNRTDD